HDEKIVLGETRHVTDIDYEKWTRRVKPRAGDIVFSYETRLGQAYRLHTLPERQTRRSAFPGWYKITINTSTSRWDGPRIRILYGASPGMIPEQAL
ncbi:MAG: hypothetical protein WC124_11800, partial [Desulfoplanes sp.]